MTPRLLGLSGRSGAGKDAVASHLVAAHGFVRIAVADALKELAARAFDLSREQLWGDGRNVLDARWQQTPRELYQRLGDGLRAIHPETLLRVWLSAVQKVLASGASVVVPDVRMPAEARALAGAGGVLWRIHRPGIEAPPGGDHTTETALDTWDAFDATIRNDGGIDELERKVDGLLRNALARPTASPSATAPAKALKVSFEDDDCQGRR